MNRFLISAASIALLTVTPASAQLLGGGGGGLVGGLGGQIGGLGSGTVGGTLDTTVERGRASTDSVTSARGSARANRSVNTRLGERRIMSNESVAANGSLSLDQQLLNTRGAVAATRRGLHKVTATASGVQVFVPHVALPGPMLPPILPNVTLPVYPAYGPGYYYGPSAVFVGSDYVDTYMDRQYRDLESGLRGTGATVQRRGSDLVVQLPADVTFAFDKADIRPRFHGALSAFAHTMSAYPATDVEVVGHTDAVGSDAYNLGLSERRGRSVADFLVQRQADPARMVVEAMGESEPVASNATVEGRAANRRVELIVHPRAG